MSIDPVVEFKAKQRETWTLGNFGDMAVFTTPVAGHLVRYAGVTGGQAVLDVGTGTGVVAITARRLGATVTGLDLTPALLVQARESATLAGHGDIAWHEGDAEALPFPDASFDVVLSQFGHMFAPRPEVALSEMLRVLKPGGGIAFATWPGEQLIGRLFSLNTRYVPPPPGLASPVLWGCRYRAATAGEQRAAPAFRAGRHGYPNAQPPAFAPVPGNHDGPFHPDYAGFAA